MHPKPVLHRESGGQICKATLLVFKVLAAERLKSSKLQESWYNGRELLEYSISKNEACCFYYLFQSIVNGKYEKFVVASKDWRKMTEKDGKIMKHESSKAHQSSVENYWKKWTPSRKMPVTPLVGNMYKTNCNCN